MQIIIQILQSLPVSSFSIQIFALPLSECLFEKKYSYHSCRGSIYSRKFQDKSAFPFPVSVSHFATETLELLTVWHCTNHQYCKESYLGRRSWGNFSCTKPTRRPSVTMWSSALPQHRQSPHLPTLSSRTGPPKILKLQGNVTVFDPSFLKMTLFPTVFENLNHSDSAFSPFCW